jgi:hypothetical protein
VDEVLKQDETVQTSDLEAEFSKLPDGALPRLLAYPREEDYRPHATSSDADTIAWLKWAATDKPEPGSSRAKYLEAMEAYEASVKAREEKLHKLMAQHPEVWKRLFQQRREKAINECILTRAKKEGVVNP